LLEVSKTFNPYTLQPKKELKLKRKSLPSPQGVYVMAYT